METDVLVIGAGAAGLTVALHAAPPRRVLLLAPQGPEATATALAKGGIAAPIGHGDSVALHVADTRSAADHSASEAAITSIVAAAGGAIDFLRASGLRFDVAADGPHLHLEAGHSVARILHADGDRTGAAIQQALWLRALAGAHVEIRRDLEAVSLLTGPDGIAGVLAQRADGSAVAIRAAETVLATGGLGQLFAATTNPAHSTGHGLAMALACGAAVAGLEFVQFHPTALRSRSDPLPLLTEALRGAGARLIADGEPFMSKVDPRGDLAPRDVVARGVWAEQCAGREVALDATPIFGSPAGGEFPAALAACVAHGIDPARSPIPVTCAAHFHMGGIAIDPCGHSSLPGLWAVGEVAYTGLHGANRLASNSLLEAIVVGAAAGRALGQGPLRPRRAESLPLPPASFDARRPEWRRLRKIMWSAMGPIRRDAALANALDRLDRLSAGLAPSDAVLALRIGLARAMLRA
ncbi:MAG TPA: FAD-binding protein, partial [Steroidobacteraceae bacterium]|nr:FAD-binding protein [Steroidobacteraceae bacterium]